MNSDQQRRVRAVFDAVASGSPGPPETQEEFVRRESGGDLEVEKAVLRLLRASHSSERFLENPLADRFDFSVFQGMRLGAYLVDRQIGEGGMGVVYRAVRNDDVYRRVTALKIMRPEYKTADKIERFRREREILAQLDHPNIARIIDGGSTPLGLPYFVMDYIEGQPIHLFCDQRKAGLTQRLNLFRQACMAVQYLHENRVIHRDLKPANMLVTNGGVVKLLDFGIAKLLEGGSQALTTSMVIASPGYASPEQLENRPTGPASDIYSLGAILYELLTGVRPRGNGEPSLATSIQAITREEIRKPSDSVGLRPSLQTKETAPELRKRLRGDLDSILMMALRQEPEARYHSVAELAADIEAFQAGRPVSARKGALLYVTSRYARRHAGALATAAVLAAALSWVGWDEWRLRELHEKMAAVATSNSLVSEAKTPENYARLQDAVRQVGQNYKTTFPRILKDPLAFNKTSNEIVDRDVKWLDQVAPLAQQAPDLATEMSRTYLDVAEAQWSEDGVSLKDADGSLASCKKALALLDQLPDAYQTDGVKKLAADLRRQVGLLPTSHS